MGQRPSKSKSAIQHWQSVLEPFLAEEPRSNGDIRGYCLLHDDHDPSASFNFGKGVWKCHAGSCGKGGKIPTLVRKIERGEIGNGWEGKLERSPPPDPLPTEKQIKAWHRALMKKPERLRFLRGKHPIADKELRKYEICWDEKTKSYGIPLRDQDGRLINVKWIRYLKNGDKQIRTVKGRPANILWPADQLKRRNIATTEGEFKALALISSGIPAVTGTNGARKWNAEWGRRFLMKNVAVLTDCDEAGRDHQQIVAENLAVYAMQVRKPELDPDQDEGFDISDWLLAGGDRAELKELVKRAPVQMPHRLQVISAWDRRERLKNEPPPRWLFRAIFMAGTYGVLAGPQKAGKSWDLAATTVSAASGEPLWGLLEVDDPCEVMYFVGEDDERLTIQRLDAICRWLKVDVRDVLSRIHVAEAVPRFGDEPDLDVVRAELEKHPRVRFTVIEPLYLTAPGADARQLFDMGGLLGAIQQVVVNEARSALLIGHHWNEGGRGTGPERFSGAGPQEWGRVLFSGNPGQEIGQPDFFIKREITYDIQGTRIPKQKIKIQRFIKQENADDPGSPFHYKAEAKFIDDRRSELTDSDRAVLEALTEQPDQPQTVNQIAKVVDIHKDNVRKSLMRLAKFNLAEHDGQKKGKKWWPKP